MGQSGGERQRDAKSQRLARCRSRSLTVGGAPDEDRGQTGSQVSSVADFRLPVFCEEMPLTLLKHRSIEEPRN